MPESKESIAYREAYEAAKAADEALSRACIAEHGTRQGRWMEHKLPATLEAVAAKHAADERVRVTLKALHARVLK